ncbi:putative PEP-binding protein [Streptomyces sp. JJ36]|uniref:putative PEP-binding protein n=1 Tax=Streptomyces sp. JJ36 TaxID=2736645 RepID=UPI001EEE9386|nr:putative PEP-binding protein [Streptomyces sp. JJ36]MCF6524883.1 phosphoenolpyruvate--protein phosphotransferase [Streptomyces sp. JJ36]
MTPLPASRPASPPARTHPETTAPPAETPAGAAAPRRALGGRPASDGTALGVLHRTDRPFAEETGTAPGRRSDPADAAARITAAFEAVAVRLLQLAARLRDEQKDDQAGIMEVNGFLAQDADLVARARSGAEAGLTAPEAVRQAVDAYAGLIAALDDPTLAERAADVRQVGRRVLAELCGAPLPSPDEPLILVAEEIGAADLLEPGRTVLGAVSRTGGPNSHAAIVARSLGIPLLLDADPAVLDLADGAELLVDTAVPHAVVHPEPGEQAAARDAMAAARARREAAAAQRHLPPETRDGHRVGLLANAATPGDADTALEARAEGVGLLRTELPFLDARTWPTRQQHTAALTPVLRRFAGLPVTVRTLDYADDKLPPFLVAGREAAGGRLGRGLPLMLAEPDAFAEQFRALLEAGAETGLRIMIPMVAGLAELRACRELLDRAAAEAGVTAPPLGVMIELPEAVAAAGDLAAEAAFLSIGSNDLTCQLLDLDRRDPAATPALAAHPAVLRAIARTVTAGHRHGRPVSVCGDAAAHPLVSPLLLGLGVDALSVAPAALDEVRARIRGLDRATCGVLAERALALSTPEEVHALVGQAGLSGGPGETA